MRALRLDDGRIQARAEPRSEVGPLESQFSHFEPDRPSCFGGKSIIIIIDRLTALEV
ncbi:unnamed protein product, partial [Nesidiocoris tenuis]